MQNCEETWTNVIGVPEFITTSFRIKEQKHQTPWNRCHPGGLHPKPLPWKRQPWKVTKGSPTTATNLESNACVPWPPKLHQVKGPKESPNLEIRYLKREAGEVRKLSADWRDWRDFDSNLICHNWFVKATCQLPGFIAGNRRMILEILSILVKGSTPHTWKLTESLNHKMKLEAQFIHSNHLNSFDALRPLTSTWGFSLPDPGQVTGWKFFLPAFHREGLAYRHWILDASSIQWPTAESLEW